jgi:hypothetical protein
MDSPSAFLIDSPAAWKAAMHGELKRRGISRYSFVRMCVESKICTRHTAECLLAQDGTVTGQRKPSMEIAIAMARLAGFNLALLPEERKTRRAK